MDTHTEPAEATRTAIVFPGMQPTAFSEVSRFMLVNPYARELYARADDTLGYRLADRYQETEGDYSLYGQISFVVNCLALAHFAGERLEVDPSHVTGPSFGARAAAVYSGVLDFADAVTMTARLAETVEDYFAREHPALVTQSMARVPQEGVAELRRELEERGEWSDIACVVDHDFTMLTVHESVLDWLQRRIRSLGGMAMYTMKPPMHSYLFDGLRDRVDEEIFAGLTWSDPRLPVIADQDGRTVTTGAGVREMLLDGFVRTVRWPDVVASLKAAGVARLCVSGADGLFTRVACTTRNFRVMPVTPRSAMLPARRRMPVAA
ncbi:MULTISPECIES: ACP S-malonyltransferase [unclassified Streptomyces]|uniref:ACP S-malonyltransferase n=1 Tax=unclassified Streptomyces TaxID=2593676 RepID=UPI002ED66EED|nr:ACP S-malonyltransferase [Streptomyces sp. NBC_00891]WSY06625.1 ACP S-malonyltransferase [Streptomyces sp. NBC_00890]WSZ08249.1 ACP S-malonyltransferase [Streptomyces sp. NBC_00869]WSZ24252.1 ACP S-malonyltransferase [Streptomyces sp. NBC_00870]